MSEEYFVNPYNFVPLEGRCKRSKPTAGELTGKITCEIKTLTPIFIPNDSAENEKELEFFHYGNNEPVIPGSEIRGMIRSVHEAAFNGCLSQVSIGRTGTSGKKETYKADIADILKKQGDYGPCSNEAEVCASCNIFGFVSGDEKRASKIRFGDALADPSDNLFMEQITLPPQGTPHPDTKEFYMQRNFNNSGNREEKQPDEKKINGRKFYWHHDYKEEKFSSQNGNAQMTYKIKPVRSKVTFEFSVFFENLTEDQLLELCSVLQLNFSDDYAHKIGRGKPLGLGSIRIKIEHVKVRDINQDGDYNLIEKNLEEEGLIKNQPLLDILTFKPEKSIEEENEFSNLVSYPIVKTDDGREEKINDTASHQWFELNRKKKGGKQTLPSIEEELNSEKVDSWLKVIVKKSNQTSKQNTKRRQKKNHHGKRK